MQNGQWEKTIDTNGLQGNNSCINRKPLPNEWSRCHPNNEHLYAAHCLFSTL